MSETYRDPERISLAAAVSLAGTTHALTRIPFMVKGVSQIAAPTLQEQQNRIDNDLRAGLAGIMRGMCRRTASLKVVCNPFRYRKTDGTAGYYEAGATELTLTASATNYVYLLHGANTLTRSTSGWPADLSTFTPLAIYVCDGSQITTADEAADARGLVLYQTMPVLATVQIGDASGASPQTVTVQVLDGNGQDLAAACLLQLGVYQDATGAAVATDAIIEVGATGSLVRQVVADKVLICETSGDGTLTLVIADAVAESLYLLAAPCPGARLLDCRDAGTVTITA